MEFLQSYQEHCAEALAATMEIFEWAMPMAITTAVYAVGIWFTAGLIRWAYEEARMKIKEQKSKRKDK